MLRECRKRTAVRTSSALYLCVALTNRRIQFAEKLRIYAQPIENLQRHPSGKRERKAPAFKTARGSCNRSGQALETTAMTDAPQEIQILEDRNWPEAADLFVSFAPHEDR